MTHQPQALSRFGIGGSEAAAALGIHPYTSPIILWENKRAELAGESPPHVVESNDAIEWGVLLEQPIRQRYADKTGKRVATPGESMFHGEHPWRRATPDGFVMKPGPQAVGEPAVNGSDIERGLEIKTASWRLAHHWGVDGSDDVPPHYLVQCAWSMHVTNTPRWDLAALIGGADFRIYTIERDISLEKMLVDRISDFWHNRVLAGVEPPPDASTDFRDYLFAKYPARKGEVITANGDLVETLSTIRALRKERDGVEDRLAVLENQLRAAAGTATEIESSLGRVLYRERAAPKRVDWKAIAEYLTAGTSIDLESLSREHTSIGKPSRPLLYPRAWSASQRDDGGE